MCRPKISVIMSVLNGEKYISEAIDSIVSQTCGDFEFIVVDDGSTDQTWQILQSYANRDFRLVTIKMNENVGTSLALNKALEVAKGCYIARQDADDVSLPERLTKLSNFLNEHPAVGLVGSQANMVDSQGKFLEIGFTIRENEVIQNTLLDLMCLCGPSVMIRRSHFESAGFYFADDMSYSEDYDLCLRLGEVALIENLDIPLYTYRQHQESVSNKKRFRQMTNKAIALERALARRYGDNAPSEYQALLARDYLRAAVLGYKEGDITTAIKHVGKAVSIRSDVLDNEEPLGEIVYRYAPDKAPLAVIEFANDVFGCLLPQYPKTKALRNKIVARYEVASAFDLANHHHPLKAVRQLSSAIIKDPTWLKNRGVRVMLFKLGRR